MERLLMPDWKNWKRWLVSDPGLPLEDQFFQTLCLLGWSISLFVILPINHFQNLSPWVDRGIVVFALVSLAATWAARRGHYYKKAYLLCLVALLDSVWFPNGGSEGSIGLYFFLAGLFLVLFFKGVSRVAGMALLVANVVCLHLIEFAWPQAPIVFQSPADRLLDLSTGYLICMFMSGLILWVVQRGFNRERMRVKGTLQALQASEERYRLLIDHAIDEIWTMDFEGRFTFISPSVEKVRGYTPAQLMGMSLEDAFAPASAIALREEIRLVVEAAARNAPFPEFSRELEEKCSDGSTIWTEVTATGIRGEDGRIEGIFGIARNITERRRADSERVRLEEERKRYEARARRNEKMESLGALAGGVAHDMNNVLGAVLGLASLHLEDAESGSAMRKDMDTIVKACQRGGSMVRGLLGFARDTLPEERELDLNVVVREAMALLERTTLQRIHLDMDLAGDLRHVKGDSAALSHALMNLCVNAIDAMPEGGTLSVRTCNDGEGTILVEVADTGCGMSSEVLDKALDPFFTTKPQGKGTGLGLPIVFGTVKAHQGKMELRSEVGKGTAVRLHFPACQVGMEAPGLADEAQPAPAAKALQFLVVDDDELLQHAMRRLLKNLGHGVFSASGGEAALAMLDTGFRPDVVILDMNMPGMDGATALPRIRALCPNVPVLLATGRADQTAINLVENHARVTLLPKPFDLGNLRRALEHLVVRQEV
jgi:PAS domain S-box-containing protein